MKRISQMLALFIIASAGMSCSSDDNSSTEKTIKLVVLDKVQETRYDAKWDNNELVEIELFSKSTHTYKYDTNGRVAAIDIYQLDEIPYDGGYIFEAEAVFTYNNFNKIKSLITTYKKTNELFYSEVYEYNANGQIIKSNHSVDNETKLFTYNAKNQVSSVESITGNYTSIANFEYDANNNLVRAYNPKELSKQEVFTYNNKHTPYHNMSIDFTYESFNLASLTIPHIKAQSNISSYKIGKDDREEWGSEFEYNTQGYPIKEVTFLKKDPSKLKRQIEYTYKEIDIKK